MRDRYDQLVDFVEKHGLRGACQCGQCIDAPPHPENRQPPGHTANLTFFKVAVHGDPDRDEFCRLTENLATEPREYGYMELGAELGGQGVCFDGYGRGSRAGRVGAFIPEHNEDIQRIPRGLSNGTRRAGDGVHQTTRWWGVNREWYVTIRTAAETLLVAAVRYCAAH